MSILIKERGGKVREQLGKLLGLIDGDTEGEKILHVDLDHIVSGRYQPRKSFSQDNLEELADSIKTYGVLQPVLLRKQGENYELIAGERRFRAAKLAGLLKIPAIIKDLSDNNIAMISVIENVQRQDLNFLEEAQCYRRLLDEFSISQEELAAKIGKSQSTIANKLRLLQISDETLNTMIACGLTERHARAVLILKDPDLQREVVEKIIKGKMTVREAEDLVARKMNISREIKRDKSDDSAKMSQRSSASDEAVLRNTICMKYIGEMTKLNKKMMANGMDITSKINDNEDGSIKVTLHISAASNTPAQGVD